MEWLYRLVDTLAVLQYNYLHLRLTDDQRFTVTLTSYPELAYSYNSSSSSQSSPPVYYTPDELRALVQYAKTQKPHKITIIPELNVPGHAGAWAGIPDLVVPCPLFTCAKGYGLLMNVTHVHIRRIMTNVLLEIIDIFDRPPFLHLGGDEVFMAEPCLREAGISVQEWNHEIDNFEQVLTTIIVQDLGYNTSQILRWETRPSTTNSTTHYRTGKVTQFWETVPNQHDYKETWFASTGLYFDQVRPYSNGWDDYKRTRALVKMGPAAIVAGTFELSTTSWVDRNVMGRLLAVALGTSRQKELTESEFRVQYPKYCRQLGWDPSLCRLMGAPTLDDKAYGTQWQAIWKQWIRNLCDRLTYQTQEARVSKGNLDAAGLRTANEYYWNDFDGRKSPKRVLQEVPTTHSTHVPPHIVPHTGILLDLVQDLVPSAKLKELFRALQPLGFNLVQLRLANDHGMVVDWDSVPGISYSSDAATPYTRNDLQEIVETARQVGMLSMPEISVTTNSGGWFKAGFLMDCPKVLCEKGVGIANNVHEQYTRILPVVLAVLKEIRQIFPSAFLHLGHDNRRESLACCQEAGIHTVNWGRFERKLSTALRMQGVDLDKILRWDNQEHIHYANRTGHITQYDLRDRVRASEASFFGTIDLEQLSPWGTYREIREWIQLRPRGLIAQVRPSRDPDQVLSKLVAFAIGVSTPTYLEQPAFELKYQQLCLKLHCGEQFSSHPSRFERHLARSCRERTANVTLRKARSEVVAMEL
jgi:hypothetical protein